MSKPKNIVQSISGHYTTQYFLNPTRLSRSTFCMILFMLSTITGEYVIKRTKQCLTDYMIHSSEKNLLQKQKDKITIDVDNIDHLCSYMKDIDTKSQQEILLFLLASNPKQVTLFYNPIRIVVEDVTVNYSIDKTCWYMQLQKNSLPVCLFNKEFFDNTSCYKKSTTQSIYKVSDEEDLCILAADSKYSVRKYDQHSIIINYPNLSTENGDGVWLIISTQYGDELTQQDEKIIVNHDCNNKMKGDRIISIAASTVFQIKAFHRDKGQTVFIKPTEQIFFKRNMNS